ncbi:sensor histidine kinase [Paenibacillus senegalensis]|uniref:sensor histidine kinase n=1 Tax=Paenibacillus senegalensis TaxID=1465766 RepID=UPI000288A72F|nr:HAMP domain-containing sensor histidine kinase [Paenibacillus senegalensis]
MSIRLRLTLWYSGILALTLLVFGVALYTALHYWYFDDFRKRIIAQANDIQSRIFQAEIGLRSGSVFTLYIDEADFRNNTHLLQLNDYVSRRRVTNPLMERLGVHFQVSENAMNAALERRGIFENVKVYNEEVIVYNHPVISSDNKLLAILQVGSFNSGSQRLFVYLKNILLTLGVVTVILAATLGWFLSRKALNPIDQVIESADQIQIGEDLSKRITYDGPHRDEIGRLTDTINGMLGRLQIAYTELDEAYRAQRRFVSDASHELRTPLTTIRGNVELLEKVWRQLVESSSESHDDNISLSLEAMRDIADEAARMSRLVNHLLSLARADTGFVMEKKTIEFLPIIEEVIRKAHLLPRTAQWRTGDLSALEDVKVWGNADYLQQLIFIFIENAFKYTPEGYVAIDALMSDDGKQAGVRIQDTGIGMDKEEVPYIFDRFYRADESRGQTQGTGLGLSIARWIIDEHGGSIEVTTAKGEGSTFVIWLPVNS